MKFIKPWSIFGGKGVPVSSKVAEKVLGLESFISEEEIVKEYGFSPVIRNKIYYSKKILTWSAEQNKNGAQWRLFPKFGFSPCESRELFPTMFSSSSIWCSNADCLMRTSEPGYRLINFASCKTTAEHKTLNKGEMITNRAHLGTVAEALIAFKLLRGEVLMRDSFHYGDEYEKQIPLIGGQADDGILLYSMPSCAFQTLANEPNHGIVICGVPQVPFSD